METSLGDSAHDAGPSADSGMPPGIFWSSPTPEEIRSRAPTFHWDPHDRLDFDVEEFLAFIRGEIDGVAETKKSRSS